jgi:thiosulfate dehydrogenase
MRFLLGVVVGIVLVGVGAFCYFALGFAPVATSSPDMPFEKRLAKMALDKVIEKEMPKTVPVPVNDATMSDGAAIYIDHCAVCHGLPNGQRTTIAAGMYPKPPQLFHGKGVTDDPVGETYWKVANGIRLTGMPAFKPSLTETQMWQVSILLANADKANKDLITSMVAAKPALVAAPAQPPK